MSTNIKFWEVFVLHFILLGAPVQVTNIGRRDAIDELVDNIETTTNSANVKNFKTGDI